MHRVYVVDDDPAVRKSFRWLLQSRNYEVRTFADGMEFFDNLIDEPDCLLLDMVMPGMNGMDALRELTLRGYEFPVIGISAYTRHRNDALSLGAVEFFAKPPDLDEMFRSIEKAVAQHAETRVIVERPPGETEWNAWFEDDPDECYPGNVPLVALNRLMRARPDRVPRPCGIRPMDAGAPSGRLEFVLYRKSEASKPCPDCGGTGKYTGLVVIENCSACNGTGRV